VWNDANEQFFKMSYPDRLEELNRALELLLEKKGKRPSDSKIADELIACGATFSFSKNTVRVEIASIECVMQYKPAWELMQDMSAHDEFSYLIQSDVFQHGVKTVAKRERTAVYWFLRKIADWSFWNKLKKPTEEENSEICLCILLAINMCHRFALAVKKEIPDLEDVIGTIWPVINDLLTRNVVNDELKQNISTTTLNADLKSVISTLKKDKKNSIISFVYERNKHDYDNPSENLAVIKDMDFLKSPWVELNTSIGGVTAKRKLIVETETITEKPKAQKRKSTTEVVQNQQLVDAVYSDNVTAESEIVENPTSDISERFEVLREEAEELLNNQRLEFNKRIKFLNLEAKDFFQQVKDEYRNKVDFMCLDPPYGILKEERDQISRSDIVDTVDWCYHLLRPKGFLVIFCAWQFAGDWNSVLKDHEHFVVFRSLLNVTKLPGKSMRQKGSSNMQNMAEYAVVAYKKGQGSLTFNYLGKQNYVVGPYNKGMNVIGGYIKPSDKLEQKGKALRIEEKSTELYMEIYSRFATLGSTVMDLYAGTASSAYAAIKLGMQWIGCEKDTVVYNLANERLVGRFNNLYNQNKLAVTMTTTFPKLPADNTLPTSNYPTDVYESLLEDCSAECIFMQQLDNLGLKVKLTGLKDLQNDEGLFADKVFLNGEVICTYWGEVLSQSLFSKLDIENKLTNRIVKIPRHFSLKAYYINGDVCCPAVYINCCIDMAEGKLFKPNAELVQNPDLNEISGLGDHDCLQVIATRNIEIGEEIFINYLQSNNYDEVKNWFSLGSKSIQAVSNTPITTSEPISNVVEREFKDSDEENLTDLNEEKLLESAIKESMDLLEKFRNADALKYEIGNKLWGRYEKLGLLKNSAYAKQVCAAFSAFANISQTCLSIIVQVLDQEPNCSISYDNQSFMIINNVLDDNEKVRGLVSDLMSYGLKQPKEILQDQNYKDSTGRRMHRMESNKELKMINFLDFMNEVYTILFPAYVTTSYNLMWSSEKTMRQGFHTDYNTFGEDYNMMAYVSFISLSDDSYVWTAREENGVTLFKRIYYPFGSMVMFTGNCVHAGAEYVGESNLRIHKYIESPNMKHGHLVSQEFKKYDRMTLELNKFM
jgi:DNA modification methylase